MSVKMKSVKLMSVNNKVRNNIGPFQYEFYFGISDLRLVENCLKMTAYYVISSCEVTYSYLPRDG